MTMPWLKLYHEARTDPKLRAISRDQHYVWFNILCFANEQPERGVIKLDDEEVLACAVADGDVDLLRSSLERLTKLRLVDRTEDAITPHGWGERQGKVDATSAERAKRYRERHKSSSGKRKNASRVTERDATRDERVCKRDVTDRHAAVTQKSRTDRERDGEEEKKRPPTPRGGEVCVSVGGSEPEPISKALPSEPAKPPFDDAELTRVGMKAEKLFPMLGFGSKIKAIAGDGSGEYPLAWIDAALSDLHASGKSTWQYLLGILRRMDANGGPKQTAKPRIHNPDPPPPGGGYWRTPENQARHDAREAAAAAAKKIERESVAS